MTLPVWPAFAGDAPARSTMTQTEFDAAAEEMMAYFADDLPTAADTWGAGMVDALAAANYSDVSTTSNSIGTGAKTFTIQSGKMFVAGQFLMVADAAAPTTNYMFCQVTSYSGTSLVLNSLRVGGSGTKTSWVIGLSGPQGEGGDVLPSFSGNAYKSLRVNAGETDAEWVDEGYVLIETLSPSGAATSTSATLPTTYQDILVLVEASITSGLGVTVSNDGSTYGGAATFFSATTASVKATFHILGYRLGFGQIVGSLTTSAGPAIGSTAGEMRGWAATGGITNLRFSNGSGNLTATILIYGKR